MATNTAKFLAKADLAAWLDGHSKAYRILAPAKEGHAHMFRERKEGATPPLERTRVSPKAAIIPASETLVEFTSTKDPENTRKVNLNLDASSVDTAPDTMIFGCRSCDTRGFLALDTPYIKGRFKDPYYAAKRAKTLLVTLSCNQPCSTCFCHWVGGGPDCAEGADVLFTELEDGFVMQAHSERGEALIAALPDAGDRLAKAEALHKAARESQAPAPDLAATPERLRERFADDAFWDSMTAKCIACGACTYMCPTCQCFTITDEGDYTKGKRLRSWDTCMAAEFTMEASGHNPRPVKANRMRNRVSHKYCFAPRTAKGQISCTGCGRCIRYCPVSFDIREVVLKATEK